MIKASVIGWPISHSRSPLIHRFWLQEMGIDGVYEKIAVAPESLSDFIHGLRHGEHVGTNVTLPHKETALAFVDEPDERVHRIGALNTIWRENGKLHATSTDGIGFVQNVLTTVPTFDFSGKRVAVLGAGGSTRALIDEMLRQNVTCINLWNRTHSKAERLAAHFGPKVCATTTDHLEAALSRTDLLVNATSAGLQEKLDLNLPWHALRKQTVVADIVYVPLVTTFLQQASRRGHIVVPGLGMLLHQAVFGFEKWFGAKPVVTQALHDLVARDIDPTLPL